MGVETRLRSRERICQPQVDPRIHRIYMYSVFFRVLTLAAMLMLPPSALTVLSAMESDEEGSASSRGTQGYVDRIEFPNEDVRNVIAFYGRLAGKHMIYDNTVQGQVNLVILQRLSVDEALKIIEVNLLLNGFTLVPGEGNIVKVIGLTKNPRAAGIEIYSDEQDLPDGEQVVTFLFKLEYADPTELQQVLSQYIAPTLYTSIVALPKSQALMITESTPVIRGIARVIREIDLPPAEVVSEFIKLERADVKDVLEKLEKIFDKQPQPGQPGTPPAVTRRTAGLPPEVDPGSPQVEIDGGTAGLLSEDNIIIGKIKLTADVRTNRIHVVTRPINLKFIRELISEFDRDVQFGVPATRVLKYVVAGDVLDVIVKAITEKGETAESGAITDPGGATRPTNTGLGSNLSGGFRDSGGSGGSGLNVSEGLATEERDTTPRAVNVGNTRIIADLRNNAIIVLGNEEAKQKIFQVLDHLDTRAPQVVLKTVIGELGLSEVTDIGFSYFLGNNDVNGRVISTGTGGGDGGGVITNPTNPTNGNNTGNSRSGIGINPSTGIPFLDFAKILNARDLSNVTPFFIGGEPGINAFLAAGDSLGMVVRALENTGRFRVTQSPVVFTSNNKKAIIASGEEIAVPTQTLSNVDSSGNANTVASVSSSVQFKQVTLQLEVSPLINSDREVTLDILQKLDSLTGEFTEVGGSRIPTIATRYIRTNVSVPSGATIALGGLVRTENRASNTGVPYLSRIPVLGYLFKSKSDTRRRSELIILMKPEVFTEPHEMAEATERAQSRLVIEPDLESTLDATSGQRAKYPPIPEEQRVPAKLRAPVKPR